MGKPTPFFATRIDLLIWLGSVSVGPRLAITEAGLFEQPGVKTLPLEQCGSIGLSDTGNFVTDKTYLIHDESMIIEVREVVQRRGGLRYSVDQQFNPKTIGLRTGGQFGENIVVSGQLGLGTGDSVSDELANRLLEELRMQFTKIKSYYVGKQASSLA